MPQLKVTTVLNFPLTGEVNPKDSDPIVFSLQYTQKINDNVVFAGAVSDQSLLGTITNAKACYLLCLTGGGTIKVNGASTTAPLAAGVGYWAWCNPNGGLTALTVTTTGAASFLVLAFS